MIAFYQDLFQNHSGSLLWYTTRGAGATTLVLFSAVVVLGLISSVGWSRAAFPRFMTTTLHRNLSLLALVFLAIHIVSAVIDPFTALGIRAALVPWGASYRPLWLAIGVISLYLLAALIITSLIRRWIPYRLWRTIHWIAYAMFPLAVIHSLGAGSDTRFLWMDTVYAVSLGAVLVVFVLRVRRRRPTEEPLPEPTGAAPRWSGLRHPGGR